MNQWPTFDDDDDDSINHTDVKKRNGTKSSIKNVIYIPDNNYKKKKNNNIEDIIDIDNKNKKLSEMKILESEKSSQGIKRPSAPGGNTISWLG